MARRADLDDDGALRAYLRAISRIPQLSAEEERELGRRIQASRGRDDEALRGLVEGNLRFVVHYAKRYRGLGVPFLDLVHEANLGLIEAAKRFDPSRNVKFITYAVWWIRQSILHALSGQSRIFSLPQKVSGAAVRYRREVARLTNTLDRAPSSAELATELKLSEGDVEALKQLGASDVSLSDLLAGDGEDGLELGETIEQATVPPAEEQVMRARLAEQLNAALGELEEKEREVVRRRYGLTRDGEPQTLQEIGESLQLSRERIRQIEVRAKDKLRHSQRCIGLRSYLN
ncbi:MAG TPA: RNA polymerase sigma factor RpoD/SigA [Vicinamibacterales bacterium]|nr:RNA polymerase sigma factor RpoD/SigA [Vicinamibacterales bacterium]